MRQTEGAGQFLKVHVPRSEIIKFKNQVASKLMADEAKLSAEEKLLAADQHTEQKDEEDESIAMSLRRARAATQQHIAIIRRQLPQHIQNR